MQLPIRAKEYFLTKPGRFERRYFAIEYVPEGFTVLSPLYTAICGSDLHYYRGEKSAKKLAERLPLILLHEGVCLDRMADKRVVPVAGYALGIPEEFVDQENLWPELPYLGATHHGLARSHLLYPSSLAIVVPDSVSDTIAALTEPFSIAIRAATDMDIGSQDTVAVIGTGGLAYLMVLTLVFDRGIPPEKIVVFGVKDNQLEYFKDLVPTVNYVHDAQPAEKFKRHFDIVFEIVGGRHMSTTVRFAVGLVRPGGKIGIMGISDFELEISSNMLVNHGIRIIGLTRSTAKDYRRALELMQDPRVAHRVRDSLIHKTTFEVDSADALKKAFDFADSDEAFGRIIKKWPI